MSVAEDQGRAVGECDDNEAADIEPIKSLTAKGLSEAFYH
jgi:hypothetical protein